MAKVEYKGYGKKLLANSDVKGALLIIRMG
jgi:hypothetical protein